MTPPIGYGWRAPIRWARAAADCCWLTHSRIAGAPMLARLAGLSGQRSPRALERARAAVHDRLPGLTGRPERHAQMTARAAL